MPNIISEQWPRAATEPSLARLDCPHFAEDRAIQRQDFFEPKGSGHDPVSGTTSFEDAMMAIVKVMSLAFPASSADAEVLKTVALFCGVGLLISLCVASFGLDLTPGFF